MVKIVGYDWKYKKKISSDMRNALSSSRSQQGLVTSMRERVTKNA